MAAPFRQAPLGDVEESAPAHWEWGSPGGSVDLLALLLRPRPRGARGRRGGPAGLPGGRRCPRGPGAGHLPLEDRGALRLPRRDRAAAPRGLGARRRPRHGQGRASSCSATRTNTGSLHRRPADGDRNLGRNGSYLVFRQLSQDVHGFWELLRAGDPRADGSADGRRASARGQAGRPLAERRAAGARARTRTTRRSADANDFGYHARRRAPACAARSARTSAAPTRATRSTRARARAGRIAVSKRHRLLRRGRKYGPLLARDDLLSAGAPGDWTRRRAACTSSASSPTSRASSSSSSTPGSTTPLRRPLRRPRPADGPGAPGGRTFTVPARRSARATPACRAS